MNYFLLCPNCFWRDRDQSLPFIRLVLCEIPPEDFCFGLQGTDESADCWCDGCKTEPASDALPGLHRLN